jgi:ubiquinone/menaquinone biosynthesis C-methylase UbiE
MEQQDDVYSDEARGRLELIWGAGFLSPGGSAEVARILGGHSIAESSVLDIGSGAGGVDIALVRDHGAAHVLGADVQQDLVELATERARAAGLADRISYRTIEPGPLPFEDASFDVVFSKDSIIHVRDKEALYREVFRVLVPGGRLLVSDWLRGQEEALTPQVEAFVVAAGHDFTMVSCEDIVAIVDRIGFDAVESDDRRAWYLGEATAELERLRGDVGREVVDRWGEEATQAGIGFWQVLVESLASGALSPAHLRARKPAS